MTSPRSVYENLLLPPDYLEESFATKTLVSLLQKLHSLSDFQTTSALNISFLVT